MAYSPLKYPNPNTDYGPDGLGGYRHMSTSTMYFPWNMHQIRSAFIDVMGLYPIHYEQSFSSRNINFSFERGSNIRDMVFSPEDVEHILSQHRKKENERSYKKQQQEMEHIRSMATKSIDKGSIVYIDEVVDNAATLSMIKLNNLMKKTWNYRFTPIHTNYMDPDKYFGKTLTKFVKTGFACGSCNEVGQQSEHKLDHHGFCPKIAEQFWGKVRKLYWHRHAKKLAI